jgi:hypothetical protein
MKMIQAIVISKKTGRTIKRSYTAKQLLEDFFGGDDLMQNMTECDCQPVGETNVVECNCCEEWFDYTLELIEPSQVEYSNQYKKEDSPLAEIVETKDFEEIPYTIQLDWEGSTVWLNNHVSKEKIVITERDSESIADGFRLLNARKAGLL